MLIKTQIYATFSYGACQFFQDAFSVRVSRRIPKGPGPEATWYRLKEYMGDKTEAAW